METIAAMPQIELRDASVGSPLTPGIFLLEKINWRINAGDFWAVGGLHNSGKSLLFTCAAGVLPPSSGAMLAFGRELHTLGESEANTLLLRIGLVFENDARLFTKMTVAQNVALPLRYHFNASDEEAAGRVEKVLEAVGLLDVAHQSAGQIARNLRQRVGLARALALQPEVLLVDNPLARLVPSESRWWRELLFALSVGHPLMAGKPVTLAVTAEDLRVWRGCARQFAVLDEGTIRCFESRDELEKSGHALLPELMSESGMRFEPTGETRFLKHAPE